ncbi:venom carboxylesterase-6-like isoform X2 [Anthonomus grandis grandis]|uniref:venom carboxylesterase-6-like isoform X2 n=1 Tax=Anthonomus grandis grandis TaxID=2921223 RepID=UPI0021665F25|nr:venom carboxylesterase-6-like isoform X2 [Anthonomus grandis grandis]
MREALFIFSGSSNRWFLSRPPQAYKQWSGILNATKDSNLCYSITGDDPNESEDCLYLNVYTPVLYNDDNSKLPVLLWIHGGGYTDGNSLYSNFGPDFLINKDIVIVTINYRLGPFGFLSTGDTIISGNAGHKDQAAAIKWTFENIQAFGGNPQAITISGQSAGGSSVGYQLLYKKNEGLFRGAILESGSPLSPWSYQDSTIARSYAFDLAKQINESIDLSNSSSLLKEFLLSVDGKAINSASAQIQQRPLPVIEPNTEDAFLTQSQYSLLENGDFIKVPLIMGTTSEEDLSQGKDLHNLKRKLQSYEDNPEKFIPNDFTVIEGVSKSFIGEQVKDLYFKNVTDEDIKMGHLIKFLSHTTYASPVVKHADLASNYTKVYFYIFSYDGLMGNVNITVKGADKVEHAEDPKYLFLKYDDSYSNTDLSRFPKEDILTHYRLIELWTNFVKYLEPTPIKSELLQNITWPVYTSEICQYLDIGENLEVNKNPHNPYYKTWVQFYDKWAKKPLITF